MINDELKKEIENLKEYEDFILNLSKEEQIERDKYLKRLAEGEIQGPLLVNESLNKRWLKYYSDEQINSEMPEDTMYNYLIKNTKGFDKQIAIKYFNTSISYSTFFKKIDQAAKAFLEMGVKKGDIITICMPNTPEAVISVYALNKIGAIANMIHPLSAENEIKDFINEVDSKIVITIDQSCEKVINIIDKTNVKNVINVSAANSMDFISKKLYKFTKDAPKVPQHNKIIEFDDFMKLSHKFIGEVNISNNPEDTAIIMHTGGTTGTPKGVMLNSNNFNQMVEQFFNSENNFSQGDTLLAIMPVFHGFGLCSSIHLPLTHGVTTVLVPKLNGKKLDEYFTKYRPNHIIGVPTLYKGMLGNKKLNEMNLDYLKYVVSGGDLVKDSIETDINNWLEAHGSKAKLCKGYGLSEAVAGVTFASGSYNVPGSVGIPMVKTNIKIVDPDTKAELPVGKIGEICVSGPSVMQGYYNHEEETNNALIDGYLHTGDLAYMDENGIFYFAQRKGNMIISSGVNVYPSNIEQVIEMHEAVSACAVVGVSDPYKIQVPKAFIVLKPGFEYTKELEEEIKELCVKNLNKYSIPASFEHIETLPQTLLGKICHNKLKEEEKSLKLTK